MTVKIVGLGTPFRWLAEAAALARAHPRVLFGAGSYLLLLALLPTVLQLLAGAAVQTSPVVRIVLQIVFMVTALVLLPPMTGGFYRLVHALREGRPAQAGDVFAVFQDGKATRRLVLNNLAFLMVIALLVLGLAMAFGGQPLLDWFGQVAALKPGSTDLPPMPDGLLPLVCVVALVMLLVNTAKELATMQVALADRDPLSAIGAGFKASLLNFGALLLFFVPMLLVALLGATIFALLAGLLAAVLSFLHPLIAGVVVMPIALAVLLVMYSLIFVFFYEAWRDTLAETDLALPPPSSPGHQIEV